MNVFHFCSALIRIIGQTLENNHFSGISFIRSFYSSTAYLISFQNIHAGSAVGCRALQGTELDGTCLAANLAGDVACEIVCRAGELFVSERIDKVYALSQFAYISSVREPDSFGNSDKLRKVF